MRTEEPTSGPIKCHKCGALTPISTKHHTPIACACGEQHAVVGVVVVSGDDLPKPVDVAAALKAFTDAIGSTDPEVIRAHLAGRGAAPGVAFEGGASAGMALTVEAGQ
jgi:hypothetical protein